jgi:hypothetical protein
MQFEIVVKIKAIAASGETSDEGVSGETMRLRHQAEWICRSQLFTLVEG